jgi:REP element-mobilizing transposase RayT
MLRGPKRNLFSPCSVLKLRRDEILVFSPKYRGKVLLGDVAEVAEEISWIAKRLKGRSSKRLRDRFP